jgi:hypothetical protein
LHYTLDHGSSASKTGGGQCLLSGAHESITPFYLGSRISKCEQKPKKARLEMTMKNLMIAASMFVALCAVSTCWAQVETSPSDSQIAVDEAKGTAFEATTGLPTGATSWMLQAGEAAVQEFGSQAAIDAAEAVSGPIGAGLGALSPSYTAGRELDEVTPIPAVPSDYDGSAFVNSYLQGAQAQQDAQTGIDEQYQQSLQNSLDNSATGASISPCYGCTVAR